MKLVSVISGILLWSVVLLAGNDNKCHRSTEGTDFWFSFMENRIYKEEYHTVQITVTALKTTDFRITVGLPGSFLFEQTFNVLANDTRTVEIPWKIVETTGSEKIQNKGIHLTSVEPVSVFAINWDPNSTDITPVYPIETLGEAYFAMCYEPNIDPNNPLSGNGRNSEFLIVATENQTTIKITPSKVTDQLVPKDSTFEVELSIGEVYQVQSENVEGSNKYGQGDLTGSRVEADKPIAFFSGALSTTVPSSQCCWDHLFEQIPPVQSWGYEYYTVPLKARAKDRFRILASKDNTTVQISGEPFLYLNEGEFREFEFGASEAKRILSDKPLLVAQFSQSNSVDKPENGGNGDPFMIILNPAGRGVNKAIFETYEAPKTIPDTTYIGIKRNFVNIVAYTIEVPNIQLDGKSVTSEFRPFSEGPWSFAQIEISKGKHIVENVAGKDGFVGYVYGFGGFESYGFGVGFNLDLTLELGENIEFFEGDTLLLCRGDTLKLDAGSQFNSYKWNTGETAQTINVTSKGEIWVEVSSESGCQLSDTVFVFVSDPGVDLGERYNEVCYPQKVLLNGGNGYEKYIWQNESNDIISTSQKYWVDKTGEYRVTVSDQYRCIARDTFGLTVHPVPEIKILGNHLLCGETITQLTVTITGTPENIWNFPNNYSWTTNSPDLVLTNESRFSINAEANKWGDFEIYYKLTTIDNCDTVVTFPIRFHPQPLNDFKIEDDPACSGYSKKLVFTGSATSAADYLWDLNGRVFLDTFDLQKQVFLISVGASQPNPSPISLAINDKGCLSDTIVKTIPNAFPNFTMEADKTRGCDDITVNLTGKMINTDNVDFIWTFNDTQKINGPKVTRNYSNPGFYKVNLTVVNPVTRCTNSFNIDSMIKVFPTPVAEITADPSFCYKDSALLIYTHHIDSSFCIWEIGGNSWSGFGYDSIVMNIYHPVELAKLTVEEFGCKSEPVYMNLKRKPIFDFSVDNEEGCQPFTIKALAKTNDTNIEFGWVTDSVPFPGSVHFYIFPDTGRYDIGLIATSSNTQCSDTLLKQELIWVHKKPYAKFIPDHEIALLDNATLFFDNTSENAVNYFWDFGDSVTSQETDTEHTYKGVGKYHVQLISETDFGCTDSFGIIIQIIPSVAYAPNAFRPDSEISENRTFMPVGAGVDEARFKLKIYNRWGEMIFETNSLYIPWDGTLKNGERAPMGNYVWISNYFDIQGMERNEKGQVFLIR
jgi:PKD repeat protein